MLFRFSQVEILPNNEYDYDNAKFLGAIEHEDYVQYIKLLTFLMEHPHLTVDMNADWCNLTCIKQYTDSNGEEQMIINNETYSIVGMAYRLPFDSVNLECIEVYISPYA